MTEKNQSSSNQQRGWLIAAVVAGVIVVITGILLFTNVFSGQKDEDVSGQVRPRITITEPAQGAVLDIANPVMVSGTGRGLPEGNVVVQAIDRDGNVLTQQPTTIDAPDAGTGGEGPWSVQLTIEIEPGMAGKIRAFSPSPADESVIAEAVVEVSFGRTAAVESWIEINEPVQGAVVNIDNPVTVSGRGAGLPEGNVVVQAIDRDGNVLTQQPTTIDASDAGTGGEGPWSVQFTIDTEPGMAGKIRAVSPSPKDNSVIAEAVVEVSFGRTAAVESWIEINEPIQGAVVDIDNPVTVSGRGAGLPEGNVVVQAIDRDGNVLTQQPTTIDAPDAGTGGEGPWSVQLTIDTEPGMAGKIRAFSASPADESVVAEAVVNVTFGEAEAPDEGPTAVIDGPTEAFVDEEVTFNANNSQPGSSSIVSYAWNFGTTKTLNESPDVSVTTVYDTPGLYPVSLIVTDQNGLNDSDSLQITIHTQLEDAVWVLTDTITGTTITAQFDNGTLNGSAGCNTYKGIYATTKAANDNALSISDLASTRKLCKESIMTQEQMYLSALETVTNYQIRANVLTMVVPGGTLVFYDQSTLPPVVNATR